jgi:hypothetical protein
MPHEHGAFEDEPLTMLTFAETIEEPLERIAYEQQFERLIAFLRKIEQTRAHRGADVLERLTHPP